MNDALRLPLPLRAPSSGWLDLIYSNNHSACATSATHAQASRGTLVTLSLTFSSGMLGGMWEIEQLAGLDSSESTPESICACVAKIFQVGKTEVALLELSGRLLNFLYPAELKMAGAIPLSSSAVAARTAQTKQAELFNGFTQVKHFSVFELVKLGNTGLDEQVIQKLMSAPVLAANGEVIGVIQVSRKATRPAAAGPDFTTDDLRKLESVASIVGKLLPSAEALPSLKPDKLADN